MGQIIKQKPQRLFYLLLSLIMFGLLFLFGVASIELLIKFKKQSVKKEWVANNISNAYRPFSVQFIDPNYMFFFSRDSRFREAFNNKYVSIDKHGFRGGGPEDAQNRKLAFLLGGSTAFGYFASSNATTITGYLNRIQTEYFFVNAGVPSWNSTQQLYRLAHQLMEYKPALIINFDGANDVAIVEQYYQDGLVFPPGTPESFNELSKLVNEIKIGNSKRDGGFDFTKKRKDETLFDKLLPNISHAMRKKDDLPLLEDLIVAAAKKYSLNQSIMRDITEGGGARFIGFHQPILGMHDSAPEKLKRDAAIFRLFTQEVLSEIEQYKLEYYNLAIFFQNYDGLIFAEAKKNEIIFYDEVHLGDAGNKLIAKYIWEAVIMTQE
ncbi:MAG: hypothetical protein DRR42_22455 [Gammaproteobacteria bacterium]|nr:MAG: hypothetical protein DRR42_22455 [Gammaproteobacteria bacterium]